jgi:hypothetical protein
MNYYDHFDADPAPRELTVQMQRYLFHQTWRTSTWFGLSAFFVAVALVILWRHPSTATGVFAGISGLSLVGATIATLRRGQRLRRIVLEGTQVPARIAGADHHDMPTNVPGVRARWSKLDVELPDGTARLVSLDRSLENAVPGCWIRVLVHPDHPGVVVPVCSLI